VNTGYQYWLYCIRCSRASYNTNKMTEVEASDPATLASLARSLKRCMCDTCKDEPSDEKFFMLTCRDPDEKLLTVDIGEFTGEDIDSETVHSARASFAVREKAQKH